jgi:hypothetical protein
MELKSLYKHGTHILTEQRRGQLLFALDRTAFLKQKNNTTKHKRQEGSEVLTVANMKMTVFWVVAP